MSAFQQPGYIADASDHPGYVPSNIYVLPSNIAAAAAVAAVDTVYLWMWLPKPNLIAKSFGLRVAAAGTASEMKVAVWRNNPATMRPTGLPARSANVGAPTVTANQTVLMTVPDLVPTPGVPLWLGVKQTGTLPTVMQLAGTIGDGARLWGGAVGSSPGAHALGLSAPDAYANDISLLDLTSATFTVVNGATGIPVWYMGT